MLTVLAPCVLPLLPIIIGGSVSGNNDKRRPYIIVASLAVSLLIFTLLLKATTLFIGIPPESINYVSGTIIILLGIVILFPSLYETLIGKLGIQTRAQRLLGKSTQNKNSLIGPIVTGAALGPVFSSCSPVYAYIIATILPGSFAEAMAYIIAYILGLSVVLLAIGLLGRRFVSKLSWATDPRGWFQRVIAVVFIIVGLLVFSGSARSVQTWVSQNTPFNFDGLSAQLIPGSTTETNSDALNVVEPYDAPKIEGIERWINSGPITNDDLKGQVTLIDFWTYSCINCIRTQPYLRGWYDTYKDSGLEIIGMHAPEFAFERVPANVERAAKEANLQYPIALDNDFTTWNNFGVRFWPSLFLVDSEGMVRRIHYGEGEYAQTEQAIRVLLKEAGKTVPSKTYVDDKAVVPVTDAQTPETYLGSKRSANYKGETRFFAGQQNRFVGAETLNKNEWTLEGRWNIGPEKITAVADARLRFNTAAKDVYLVGSSDTTAAVRVTLDGKPISQTASAGSDIRDSSVNIQSARLYKLVRHQQFRESVIELTVPAGVSLTVFTFGS